MTNKQNRPLDRQPASLLIRIRAFASRHQRLLLNLGIAAVGLFGLALLRQALTVDAVGVAQTAPLLSAYHKNGLIGLLFFGAIASGYIYWCLQFLANATPERLRRRYAWLTNLVFVTTVGTALVALLLWNANVLLVGHAS